MFSKSRSLLLSLTIPLALFSAHARADSIQLYVGYADNLRPSGFFPTPYAGSPGVIYFGDNPATTRQDSGVIRIDDTGANPLTISNLTITLNPGTGPRSFALWTAPVTILPGEKAIYAETVPNNFDSSDFPFLPTLGIDPSHPVGGCTNPGALSAAQQNLCVIDAPTISFDENGTLVSSVDAGNVLNTFGYDFVNGSSDGNESINWNVVGTFGGRGGDSPEPSSFSMLAAGSLLALAASLINRKLQGAKLQ